MTNLNRYALSKDLIFKSDRFERSVLSSFIDKSGKLIQIKRNNYIFKAFLGIIALNSYINWKQANEENLLHRNNSHASCRYVVLSSLAFLGGITFL